MYESRDGIEIFFRGFDKNDPVFLENLIKGPYIFIFNGAHSDG